MCYGQCDAVFVNAESTLLWSSECSCSPENGGLDTMIFGMTVSHIENEAGPCGWGSQRSGCGTNANTFQIGGGVPIWAATIVCPEPYANDVIFCQHPSVPPPPPDECFVFYDDAYCFTYGKMFALGGGLARTGFWHYNFAYGCYSKCDWSVTSKFVKLACTSGDPEPHIIGVLRVAAPGLGPSGPDHIDSLMRTASISYVGSTWTVLASHVIVDMVNPFLDIRRILVQVCTGSTMK